MNRLFSHAIITLFLCGDIMTGRGIDQILPHSVDPQLYEPFVHDARRYVELAEQVNGPIQHPVDFDYVWGDALEEFRHRQPDVKIINLETSVTAEGEPWPDKGINYRMHPGNVPLLTTAGIDISVLANNHVLDWDYQGLTDTLATLRKASIKIAGAGDNRAEAAAPAVMDVAGKGRVLVFSFGSTSSGIPPVWAATPDRPGVNLLPDLSTRTVERIADLVRKVKRPEDIVVASIHWGGNWGYQIPAAHRSFAHQLLDRAGVDLIHGHSSHHALGIEVHHGKLILYGCGDLITDYEGIGSHEAYRGDLGLLYFARIDTQTGKLAGLDMVPMPIRKFRLQRAARPEAEWLRDTLNREGLGFGTDVTIEPDNTLVLHWQERSSR